MNQSNDVGVFNPLSTNFSCNYDIDGAGPKTYTVLSREMAYFLPPIAKHIKKHLYDAILNERNLKGTDLNANPAKKQAILDEMEFRVET